MKTRIRHYSKSAFAILLAVCMVFSCLIQSGAAQVPSDSVGLQGVWIQSSQNNWGSTSWQVNNTTSMGTNQSFKYVYFPKDTLFRLWTNNYYSPSSDNDSFKTTADSDNGKQGGYNGEKNWKFGSASQLVKFCIDQNNGKEWNPWIWLEAAQLYVIGDSGLCGANWTHGTAADMMSLKSGKYEITKTVATAGTYEFKIGDGTSWASYNPLGNNESVTTTHNGDQVKIVFDPSDNSVTSTVIHPTYSVTLNANGGTINSGDVTSYECGTGATLPTDVTKNGYTFTGWYTASSGGTKVTSISTTEVGNKTYYARWTAKKYTITYKDQGNATFSGTHESGYPTTHTYGTATTLKSATKSGYNFLGWFTDSSCTGSDVTTLGATAYTSDITLYAKWETAGTCGFTLNKNSTSIDIGSTDTFTATPNNFHTSSGTITATSDDTGVATVSKNGNTYTVTAVSHGTATITVSCSEGGSASFSVTVKTPVVSISLGSSTLNIGETTTITPSVTNQGTAAITYTSSNTSVATISGTTITAKAPGTTKIKATVDGVNSTEITLTVRTPEFTLSYSPSTIYTGGITSTPTVTIKSGTANSSSTKSSLTYSITSGGASGSIDSTSGVVTSTSTNGTVTVKVRGTITYNGESYTTAEGTANIVVNSMPNVYFECWRNGTQLFDGSNQMIYDSVATAKLPGTDKLVFKISPTLSEANSDYYIRFWDGAKNYKPTSEISASQLLPDDGVSCEISSDSQKLTTTYAGTYTFYYDYINHNVYVEYPALVCSYTVNAKYAKDSTGSDYSNDLSGATVSPASGSWTEGDSAIPLSAATVQGYTFAQWAITSGEGSITNATSSTEATFTPSSDNVVVTAQYKKNYTVSYNAQPNNGTVSVDKTGLVAGETFTVTFTPNSGYIVDIVSVSNDQNPSITSTTYTGTASGDESTIAVQVTFAQSTVTVAGNSTVLFGTTWDSANASNNMATTDDINYTKVYSNVALTAGTIELKVVIDHNWDTAYPSDNYQLSIPKNGNYNVTVTYNGTTHAVDVEADLIKEYYLLGFGTGDSYWGTSSNREVAARKMTYNSTTGKYTLTYHLVQQTYQGGTNSNDGFKVYCNDGTWFGHNGSGDNMTRSNSGPWTMNTAADKGNIGVVADVADDYIFEFDPAGPNIKIYYPNTVTFNTHGGSAVDSQVVTYGGNATRPVSDPTKTGHTFNNWYTAESGGSVFGFANTAITAATTVHAQWTKNSYSITYPNAAQYTIGGTKPASAYYGDNVSFTVTAASGYRISAVKYNDGTEHTLTGNNNAYSFTMPATNVTISVTTVKTYTVSLTASETGISGKGYRIGTSGNYTAYSSTLTVDTGSTVSFKITYDTGYEYDDSNSTLNGAIPSSSNTVFTFSNITSNKTITIAAKMTDYALEGSVSPAHGSVKFYSDSDFDTNITTANYQQTVYVKYTPADGYRLKNFTVTPSGGSASIISATNNAASFTMSAAATTVTANVMLQYSVTYYVDMQNNEMAGKNIEVAVTNASGSVLQDSDGNDCKKTLQKQGTSTVYAFEIHTPVTKNNNNTYGEIHIKIWYGSSSQSIHISSDDATAIMNSTSPEVWIEALNESANTYKVTYKPNTTTAVESGKKRIYVAKPNSWQDDEPSWKNLRLYHWGDYGDIGWSKTPTMTCIGYDSNYHYYYVDIDSGINNIIFQGWKDNSNYPDVQTGNIENIGSSNYFILSKDGGSYVGTKGENATPPGYTRYVESVAMNVGDTANITPTHTGAKVTYSVPEGETRVTVEQDGSITANATTLNGVTDYPVTITVKVFGSVGAKATGNEVGDIGDVMTYTVTVSVRNPGIFSGFKVMSFAHQEYTVKIPEVSGDQPGYFVLDNKKTSVVVNGLYDGSGYTAKYSNSAIIKPMGTVDVENVGEDLPTSFTVKYAASNASKGYSNITLNDAMVTTVSIKKTGAKRFGFKEWTPSQASITTSKVINNGVETVTHKELAFAGTATYQAIFEEYDYVDVTFNFEYDEYVPQQVTEYEEINGVQTPVRTITDYQYDSTWAAQAGAHTTKKYTVSGFEVRNLTTDSQKAAGATKLISGENLVIPAVAAIEALPSNDYYNYKIESSGITINSTGDYVATVTVVMTKSERTYSVYLNGAKIGSNYTYQAYADLNTGNTVSKWYAVKDNAAINAQSPLLATGTGYKFRVKGDTYLRTQEGTLDNDSFNRSENGFANYEITHRQSGSAMKEYLLQNFYIADFFDQDKVKDLERGDGSKADEANFVGGGVVYYSVTDNQPYSKAVDAGYVNAGDGTAVASEIKTMLKRNIEANYGNYEDLAAAVGEEEAMKVVYGQAIPVTNNTENGAKTGVLYRYLPLENYTVDANNNITKELNSDVFRYSNSLQSYQYIYASGNENKATNSGKNMRLYSYYIYSYRTYDKDTNVPRLNYEVVLSDQYSDASTYWAGNSND